MAARKLRQRGVVLTARPPERPMDKNDALGWMPCQLGYAP